MGLPVTTSRSGIPERILASSMQEMSLRVVKLEDRPSLTLGTHRPPALRYGVASDQVRAPRPAEPVLTARWNPILPRTSPRGGVIASPMSPHATASRPRSVVASPGGSTLSLENALPLNAVVSLPCGDVQKGRNCQWGGMGDAGMRLFEHLHPAERPRPTCFVVNTDSSGLRQLTHRLGSLESIREPSAIGTTARPHLGKALPEGSPGVVQ